MDEFIVWHKARVLRRTGSEPAASTLRSVRVRLTAALRAVSTPGASVRPDTETMEKLAAALSDAEASERLLDRLSVTNTPGSLRLVYEACKAFYGWAFAQGWVDDSRMAMVAPAKNPPKPVTVYRQDEVDALVTTARGKSLRWWAFLAVMAHTGRRVNEVLSLRWDWLHLDSEVPHFELPTTKNKRQAYVPLDRFLVEQVFTPDNVVALKADESGRFQVRGATEFVFPWEYTSVEKMLRRHCARVGVPHRGFHCLRHTKATEMLARGVPIQAVSAILGHANIATTDRIYHHATALNYAGYLEAVG